MRLWVAMPSLAGVRFLAVASPVSCIQSESLAGLWLLSQSCRSWILHRSMLQRQVRKSCIFAMPHAPEPSPQKRWLLHCSINLSLSLFLSPCLSLSTHSVKFSSRPQLALCQTRTRQAASPSGALTDFTRAVSQRLTNHFCIFVKILERR